MQGNEKIIDKTTNGESSLSPIQTRLIGSIILLFCLMIVLSIASLVVSIKRKNKRRIIYQIILSVMVFLFSYLILDKRIALNIFGINSDLYTIILLLSVGNILTLINILKK